MEAMHSLPAGVHKLLLDVTNEASIKAAVAKVCGNVVSEALECGWSADGCGCKWRCMAGLNLRAWNCKHKLQGLRATCSAEIS